eukprot:gene44194-59855_t
MTKIAKPVVRKPAARQAVARTRRAREPVATSPKAYHHGDLRRVLIEAALRLVEDGPEIVRLSKEHAELKPVADAVMALSRVMAEAPELEEMAAGGRPWHFVISQASARLPKNSFGVGMCRKPPSLFPGFGINRYNVIISRTYIQPL